MTNHARNVTFIIYVNDHLELTWQSLTVAIPVYAPRNRYLHHFTKNERPKPIYEWSVPMHIIVNISDRTTIKKQRRYESKRSTSIEHMYSAIAAIDINADDNFATRTHISDEIDRICRSLNTAFASQYPTPWKINKWTNLPHCAVAPHSCYHIEVHLVERTL